jgi:hypothetical protein
MSAAAADIERVVRASPDEFFMPFEEAIGLIGDLKGTEL